MGVTASACSTCGNRRHANPACRGGSRLLRSCEAPSLNNVTQAPRVNGVVVIVILPTSRAAGRALGPIDTRPLVRRAAPDLRCGRKWPRSFRRPPRRGRDPSRASWLGALSHDSQIQRALRRYPRLQNFAFEGSPPALRERSDGRAVALQGRGDTQRVVSENCQTLRFKSHGFERS